MGIFFFFFLFFFFFFFFSFVRKNPRSCDDTEILTFVLIGFLDDGSTILGSIV